MEEIKKIGNKIAQARKLLRFSQADLAQKLFVSSQAVGKWERGESMPDIMMFNKLAEILQVDLNYFSEYHNLSDNNISMPLKLDKTDKINKEEQSDDKLGWDMSYGNWKDSDFSGLKNLHKEFIASNMQRCLFINSQMTGITFKGNNIERCDFSQSDLSMCRVEGSHLSDNIFKECSMKEIQFLGTYISGNDFSGTDFSNAKFINGGIEKSLLADVVWQRTSFKGLYLSNIVFEGTIEGCSFESNDFNKVIFNNARLLNTFFKDNRKMKKVQFVNCKADKITYAFLQNANVDLNNITLL